MRQYLALALVALLLASGQSKAQTAEFTAQMQQINARTPAPHPAEIRNSVLGMLQETARSAGYCMPTGVEMESPTPATADRSYVLGIGSGKFRNAWLAYGRPTGCPDGERQRFMLVLMADDALRAGMLNKGESLASPSLMFDAFPMASKMAKIVVTKGGDKSCMKSDAAVMLLGSRIASRSSDLSPDFYSARYTGNWEEVWTLKVCDRKVEMPVVFRADGQGGAFYNASERNARLIP